MESYNLDTEASFPNLLVRKEFEKLTYIMVLLKLQIDKKKTVKLPKSYRLNYQL